jgi:hypothetical protein
MAKWHWDRRAEAEFRDACADSSAGRAFAGEVAYALELLRAGRPGVAVQSHGRIRILPVHTESPCCILFALRGRSGFAGLHFARCHWTDLPDSAIKIADVRLEDPEF